MSFQTFLTKAHQDNGKRKKKNKNNNIFRLLIKQTTLSFKLNEVKEFNEGKNVVFP